VLPGEKIFDPVPSGATKRGGSKWAIAHWYFRYLLIFLATLPVSTASAERSFSQLSRIKSYCRSTMKQNRLNELAATYIHKDLDINPDEILKLYTQMNPRRLDFSWEFEI